MKKDMKGIIFEVNKKKAVALDSEGNFVNLKNNGYTVGAEVNLSSARISAAQLTFARFAAVLSLVIVIAAACVLSGLYYNVNYSVAYTVQLDINPSVTAYVNSKNIVLRAEGNNDDGLALNPNRFKGETLNDFITKYIDSFIASEIYDSETEYTVVIAVEGKNVKTETISESVESTVRSEFESNGIAVTTETESGIKEPEVIKEFKLTFVNLLADEKEYYSLLLHEGETIVKPMTPYLSNKWAENGLSFAFWWDGVTFKEETTVPIDFFGEGECVITADTELCAVWSFNGGYTTNGADWMILPEKITATFVLVYPDTNSNYTQIISRAEVTSLTELKKALPTRDILLEYFKKAGISYNNYECFWSLSPKGTLGDYFYTEEPLTRDLVLYVVFYTV